MLCQYGSTTSIYSQIYQMTDDSKLKYDTFVYIFVCVRDVQYLPALHRSRDEDI